MIWTFLLEDFVLNEEEEMEMGDAPGPAKETGDEIIDKDLDDDAGHARIVTDKVGDGEDFKEGPAPRPIKKVVKKVAKRPIEK
jgi:hypothetical protein